MTSQKLAGIILIAGVIVIVGYGFLARPPSPEVELAMSDDAANVINSKPVAGEEGLDNATAARTTPGKPEQGRVANASPEARIVELAMKERALGDDKAPVTIQEFLSLSCKHCAVFHEETLVKLKEAYVDTGKVRLVFTDLPTSASASAAAKVARCLPYDEYFRFMEFLLDTQEEWAYGSGYPQYLAQNAKRFGGNEAVLRICLESKDMDRRIAEAVVEAREKHQIKSTPSFVINGEEVITGALPFSVFQEKIDGL